MHVEYFFFFIIDSIFHTRKKWEGCFFLDGMHSLVKLTRDQSNPVVLMQEVSIANTDYNKYKARGKHNKNG